MVTPRFAYALTLLTVVGAVAPSFAQRVELLDFYLPTCAPCRAMEPTIARLAAEGVSVRKVDGSREPRLTQQLRVESYPTFVLMADGREVGRLVGSTSYESLRELLARAAAPAAVRPVAQTFTPPQRGAERAFAVGGDHGPGLPATAAGPSAGSPSGAAPSAAVQLLAASVRLTVDDPSGRAFGTGTVIDAREGEALVVTCAHLFRGPDGQPIDTTDRLSVELYDASAAGVRVRERVAGQLIAHDFEADVALVAIRPTGSVQAARVAASPASIAVSDAVRSVGCDLGDDPTVRDSRVVSLDRYHGAPNIETTGAPIQGRSGGGLFNAAGELIGVCFAADEAADEGLYSGLASVHKQLDSIGLTAIYRGGGASPLASVASADPTPMSPPAAAPAPRTPVNPFAVASTERLAPVERAAAPAEPQPVIRGQNSVAPPLSAIEQATLEEVVARGQGAEVVILIRPEQGGSTEVVTLDAASPEFVATLRRMRGGDAPPIR